LKKPLFTAMPDGKKLMLKLVTAILILSAAPASVHNIPTTTQHTIATPMPYLLKP